MEKIIKRGRPKGSTNKPNKVSFLLQENFDKQLEGVPICKNSNRGWINWGSRNDFPYKLSELYFNSIVHKSCVDFAVTAILGDGVDYEAMNMNKSEFMPNYQQTWDDFIRCISLDYIIYGSFAFQIIKNRDDKTYSYYHQPMSSVRASKRDENGEIKTYWICQDWTATGKYTPIEIDAFGFKEDETIKSSKPYLFVYSNYSPDVDYYSSPYYIGGLKAIQTELELIRYDLRAVKNNFSANGFLFLPRVEDDRERQMLLNNIKESFVGADNANSIVVTFVDGITDENIARFVKIDKDSNNVNLFSESYARNVDRIVSAHRIPTKSLIGMPTDSASLGGDGNQLNVSWNLYNKTIVTSNRNAIIRTINKMFKMNGIDTELILKPLDFSLLVQDNVSVQSTEPAIGNINKITDVEEKVVNDEQY